MAATTAEPHTEAAQENKTASARYVSVPMSVFELARDELARADGDMKRARAAMQRRLATEEGTLHAMLDSVIAAATACSSQAIMSANRRAVVAANTGMKASAAHALASVVGRAWLDFPLAGGLSLRHATRADLLRQADLYSTQADTMSQRARWLQIIAGNVPDGARVGDVLDDAQVGAMFTRASAA